MEDIFALFVKYLEDEDFSDWEFIFATVSVLDIFFIAKINDPILIEINTLIKNGLNRDGQDDFTGSGEIIDPLFEIFRKDKRSRLYLLLNGN